jgi:hypothetical protein
MPTFLCFGQSKVQDDIQLLSISGKINNSANVTQVFIKIRYLETSIKIRRNIT